MPNKIILNISGDTVDVDRDFLENWYRETNPYDYSYDLMKHELSRTTIKDLADLYVNDELSEDNLNVTYELLKDPTDTDVAEELMREIRVLYEDLQWMLKKEDIIQFLENLLREEKGN